VNLFHSQTKLHSKVWTLSFNRDYNIASNAVLIEYITVQHNPMDCTLMSWAKLALGILNLTRIVLCTANIKVWLIIDSCLYISCASWSYDPPNGKLGEHSRSKSCVVPWVTLSFF